MFKFIKKLFKIVGAIVGGYAIINTLVLAKMGASRIARQVRLQYDDLDGCSFGEKIVAVDMVALEEEENEWEAIKNFKPSK